MTTNTYSRGWFLLHPLAGKGPQSVDCFGGRVRSDGKTAVLQTVNGTRQLPTAHAYGALFCWYAPDDSPPQWRLEALPDHGFPELSFFTLEVKTRPGIVMRDLADYRHFDEVHGYREFHAVKHFSNDGPVANLRADCVRDQPLAGAKLPMRITFDCTCFGVGLQVAEVLALGGTIKSRHLVCPTPIDESTCRVTLGVTAGFWLSRDFDQQSAFGRFLSRFAGVLKPFLRAQYRRDIGPDAAMWERLFVSGFAGDEDDPQLQRFHAWNAQFSSPPADEPAARIAV